MGFLTAVREDDAVLLAAMAALFLVSGF